MISYKFLFPQYLEVQVENLSQSPTFGAKFVTENLVSWIQNQFSDSENDIFGEKEVKVY